MASKKLGQASGCQYHSSGVKGDDLAVDDINSDCAYRSPLTSHDVRDGNVAEAVNVVPSAQLPAQSPSHRRSGVQKIYLAKDLIPYQRVTTIIPLRL